MNQDNQKKCNKCGYGWKNRKENPKCCPNCMSRKWNDNNGRMDKPITGNTE